MLQPIQTKVPSGLFGLGGSVVSPYYPSGWGISKTTVIKFLLQSYQPGANGIIYPYGDYIDISTNTVQSSFSGMVDTTVYDTKNDILNAVYASVVSQAATLSYSGFALGDVIDLTALPDVPMYVSGVAKTSYYAVVGSPTVAGGSGVARFYIDTNGDGTGTAPSEVYSGSLQAVVINSTTVYAPTAVSVDTNRKYIDVTMKSLTFATGLAGILNVLTGASLAAAVNGTTVNCFVLVKQ